MKIVLFDLDSTLVDAAGNPTAAAGALKQLLNDLPEGILCGLNSDTPLDRLDERADQLGFHARGNCVPLIAENGALGRVSGMEFHDALASDWTPSKEAASIRLRALDGVEVLQCDAARACRRGLMGAADGTRVALVDSQRAHSLGVWYRRVRDGTLAVDADHAAACDDALSVLPGPVASGHVHRHLDAKSGLTIVRDTRITKSRGVRRLVDLLGHPADVYMVGDSINDVIDDPRVVHCAVGNASEEFKRRADKVADGRLTDGCVELLEWISRRE